MQKDCQRLPSGSQLPDQPVLARCEAVVDCGTILVKDGPKRDVQGIGSRAAASIYWMIGDGLQWRLDGMADPEIEPSGLFRRWRQHDQDFGLERADLNPVGAARVVCFRPRDERVGQHPVDLQVDHDVSRQI